MKCFSIICLAIFLSGCGLSNSQEELPEHASLEEAATFWSDKGLSNYTYVHERTCECGPPNKYTVEVRNGSIKNVYFEKQSQMPHESEESLINNTPTIDELFERLQQYETTAAHFEVEFDKKLGYPTRVDVDPSLQMADEELDLTISGVQRLNR